MKIRPGDLCIRCKQRTVEVIEDYVSWQCSYCNDREIDRANERREFDHWHREDDL